MPRLSAGCRECRRRKVKVKEEEPKSVTMTQSQKPDLAHSAMRESRTARDASKPRLAVRVTVGTLHVRGSWLLSIRLREPRPNIRRSSLNQYSRYLEPTALSPNGNTPERGMAVAASKDQAKESNPLHMFPWIFSSMWFQTRLFVIFHTIMY